MTSGIGIFLVSHGERVYQILRAHYSLKTLSNVGRRCIVNEDNTPRKYRLWFPCLVSVPCFHASVKSGGQRLDLSSDFSVMNKTVQLAKSNGVLVGAHPSLPDLQGFGRREMAIEPVPKCSLPFDGEED